MLTWQAENGCGLEGARLLFGTTAFRALGRLIRASADGEWTASYRLVVGDDGTLERLSVTSATTERERHLTINRTEDGYWLLDTGAGGTRGDYAGAADVDLAHSPMLNTVPIRRLGLHRTAGEHTIPVVFVSLPELDVRPVQQTYRTISLLDDTGHAVIEFRRDDFSAELVVDENGVIVSCPGVATRLTPGVTQASH